MCGRLQNRGRLTRTRRHRLTGPCTSLLLSFTFYFLFHCSVFLTILLSVHFVFNTFPSLLLLPFILYASLLLSCLLSFLFVSSIFRFFFFSSPLPKRSTSPYAYFSSHCFIPFTYLSFPSQLSYCFMFRHPLLCFPCFS